MDALIEKLHEVDKEVLREMCKAHNDHEIGHFVKARKRITNAINNLACIESARQGSWQER